MQLNVIKLPFKFVRSVVGKCLRQMRWKKLTEQHAGSNHIANSSFNWLDNISQATTDRELWINMMVKIVYPVINHLANGTLKKNMPKEKGAEYFMKVEDVTYLEAVGRTIAGIAPWLALPDDGDKESLLRLQLRNDLLKGLKNSVNPSSPDYLSYSSELQTIVDAAYLVHGFIRAKEVLWDSLDKTTQQRFIANFKSLRNRYGAYNNWLLFSGFIETFLFSIDEDFDPARINIAIEKMQEWYVGDGWYSDGPKFSMDYYNSFVIHPMLVDMLKILATRNYIDEDLYEKSLKRIVRQSVFLERMISPDGTFAPIGRSITYRTAAFQALSQTSLLDKLPNNIHPAQVRCGLTKVLLNLFEYNQNFDKNGWLVLGFNGYQPMLADTYTSTGSLYMASLVFLPLGLPAESDFWASEARPWSSKKAWQGLPLEKDYKVEY